MRRYLLNLILALSLITISNIANAQCDPEGVCCNCIVYGAGDYYSDHDIERASDACASSCGGGYGAAACGATEACVPISDYKYLIVGGAILLGAFYSKRIF